MEEQEKQKIIIVGDASLKRETDLFLLEEKTNTISQSLSVIKELLQKDDVEVDIVSSKDLSEFDIEKLNQFYTRDFGMLNTDNLGKSFSELIGAMRKIDNSSILNTSKNRDGSKVGYHNKSVTKRRSKKKQARKARKRNRK